MELDVIMRRAATAVVDGAAGASTGKLESRGAEKHQTCGVRQAGRGS